MISDFCWAKAVIPRGCNHSGLSCKFDWQRDRIDCIFICFYSYFFFLLYKMFFSCWFCSLQTFLKWLLVKRLFPFAHILMLRIRLQLNSREINARLILLCFISLLDTNSRFGNQAYSGPRAEVEIRTETGTWMIAPGIPCLPLSFCSFMQSNSAMKKKQTKKLAEH